jgi:hypothetical protein
MQNSTAEPTSPSTPPLQDSGRLFQILAGTGVGALALGLILGLVCGDGLRQFMHSYLVSFCYVLSIALGALFFVAVNHVCRAGWSICVRRICEILAANMLLMAILFAPLLLGVMAGSHGLYEWVNPELANAESEEFNALIAHKRPYLNVPFFALRALGYFVIWWLLTRFFLKRSIEQDETGDPDLTLSMERWSGPSLLLFAVTVTLASIDWLMSLEAEWFSTIFGLYFFAGSVVSSLAAITLTAMGLQRWGRLDSSVTVEHYHDLGKLMLGFVVFWGYMGFSQYMLIWYANVPEETVWYLERQSGGWLYLTLALLFGHLFIPFFGLLSREVKRSRPLLAFWAVWLLVFHWLDLYWLVMPSLGLESPPFGLMDLVILVGMVSLYAASFLRVAGTKPLVARRDPRIAESLAFENY